MDWINIKLRSEDINVDNLALIIDKMCDIGYWIYLGKGDGLNGLVDDMFSDCNSHIFFSIRVGGVMGDIDEYCIAYDSFNVYEEWFEKEEELWFNSIDEFMELDVGILLCSGKMGLL